MSRLENYGEVDEVRWADITTLGVGLGTCVRLRPRTLKGLKECVGELVQTRRRHLVVGGGSNLVGSDAAFDGVVLDLRRCCAQICHEGPRFIAGSAVTLLELARFAAERGYGGLAKLCGIPGRLGGAATMNAGALGQEIGTLIAELRGLYAGREWSCIPQPADWGYRHGALPDGVILTEVVVNLPELPSADADCQIRSELRRRASVTPRGRSAGSVFRNPPGRFAGALLEQCGCKGLCVHDLRVSEAHANWIVRTGGAAASAAECRQLVEEMRRRVSERFGVELECEWRWVDDLAANCACRS